MMASSTTEFALIRTLAGNPAWWLATSAPIRAIRPERTESGATISCSYDALRDQPDRLLNRCATSSPIASLIVSRPKSSYRRAVFGL
jgi:hypothetical protein